MGAVSHIQAGELRSAARFALTWGFDHSATEKGTVRAKAAARRTDPDTRLWVSLIKCDQLWWH
jgi:hypothetical protein